MIDQRIEALSSLARWMKSHPNELELARLKSEKENPWFTEREVHNALAGISDFMLEPQKLNHWLMRYRIANTNPKHVGIILAGNIPAVGFHDVLCAYISGHVTQVKLSQKDKYLIPALFEKLNSFDPNALRQIKFVDKLHQVDALIATGTNNSSRYFNYYFKDIPRLIRKNRNSIALIDSKVRDEQIAQLGRDVFDYYGLGCRSVSQILVSKDFDTNRLFDQWDSYQFVMDNTKYENNFKYNYAISMMNRESFKTNDFLIMKESEDIASRISCVHIHRYSSDEEVVKYCNRKAEEIQIVVSNQMNLNSKIQSPVVPIGHGQQPGPEDYADGVDTMKFLIELS